MVVLQRFWIPVHAAITIFIVLTLFFTWNEVMIRRLLLIGGRGSESPSMQSPSSAFCWLCIGWGSEQDQPRWLGNGPREACPGPSPRRCGAAGIAAGRRCRTSPLAPGRRVVY